MGMEKPGHDSGLAPEPQTNTLIVLKGSDDGFQGSFDVQWQVSHKVHDPHASPAQLSKDLIAPELCAAGLDVLQNVPAMELTGIGNALRDKEGCAMEIRPRIFLLVGLRAAVHRDRRESETERMRQRHGTWVLS
jgi:hypothetical protein